MQGLSVLKRNEGRLDSNSTAEARCRTVLHPSLWQAALLPLQIFRHASGFQTSQTLRIVGSTSMEALRTGSKEEKEAHQN
jgi:hypothetical protein